MPLPITTYGYGYESQSCPNTMKNIPVAALKRARTSFGGKAASVRRDVYVEMNTITGKSPEDWTMVIPTYYKLRRLDVF